MLNKLSPRLVYFFGFLICAGLLAFALYLQYFQKEDPCPLCIFQRVVFILIGIFFLIAALHNPKKIGAYIYTVLITLSAGIGIALAGRHVWLQNLPKDKVPECGPDLQFMLENFPLSKMLSLVLKGSGECAAAGWRFLSLTIPAWSLIFYILLTVLAIAIPILIRRAGLKKAA